MELHFVVDKKKHLKNLYKDKIQIKIEDVDINRFQLQNVYRKKYIDI